MDKKYKLIIINNQTQSNYSLSINSFVKYCMFFFITFFLFFFSIGIFRFFKPHEKQQKINNMLAYKYNSDNLIYNLYTQGIIDSNIMNNHKFNNSSFNLVPNYLPVKGVVTKGIDLKNIPPHNGIDIAAKSNSKVKAAQEGMVIFSNPLNDYGNTIILAHPNNYYSVYSHLEKCILKEREYVLANQTIGYVGQTGNSDGPHLHFEIWKNHHIIDPQQLIKEYEIKDVSIK